MKHTITTLFAAAMLTACGTTAGNCDPAVQRCHENGAPGNSNAAAAKGLGQSAAPGRPSDSGGKPSNPGKPGGEAPGKGDGGKPGKGDGKGKGKGDGTGAHGGGKGKGHGAGSGAGKGKP